VPDSGICPVDYGLGFHRDPRRCLKAIVFDAGQCQQPKVKLTHGD
jgi:hypothetical protein